MRAASNGDSKPPRLSKPADGKRRSNHAKAGAQKQIGRRRNAVVAANHQGVGRPDVGVESVRITRNRLSLSVLFGSALRVELQQNVLHDGGEWHLVPASGERAQRTNRARRLGRLPANDSFRNVARECDLGIRLGTSACTSVASFRCAAVEHL